MNETLMHPLPSGAALPSRSPTCGRQHRRPNNFSVCALANPYVRPCGWHW